VSDELQFITADGAVCTVGIGTYPDSMPLIHQPLGIPYRVLLRPKSLASFMAAMFWIDALTERTDNVPHLVLPFVPGARQDRLNDSGDYLFTAKSIARELNMRGFPSVTVLDPRWVKPLDAAIAEAARQLRARYGRVPLYHAIEVEPWSRIPERRWALVTCDL
jgi:hypothetical protein